MGSKGKASTTIKGLKLTLEVSEYTTESESSADVGAIALPLTRGIIGEALNPLPGPGTNGAGDAGPAKEGEKVATRTVKPRSRRNR